jgi:hypothetical protein
MEDYEKPLRKFKLIAYDKRYKIPTDIIEAHYFCTEHQMVEFYVYKKEKKLEHFLWVRCSKNDEILVAGPFDLRKLWVEKIE